MAKYLTHNVGIYFAGYFTSTITLKAVDTSNGTDFPDAIWAFVESEGEYYLDRNSTITENLPSVVAPSIGQGRWIKKAITITSNKSLLKYFISKLGTEGGTLTDFLTLNADPTNPLHAATKQYVDNALQGLDVKASVRVATTANITLSGTQTIDGVALSVGDRVLVKDQTTTKDNGIYVVSASTWTRATDMNSWSEVAGAFAFVEEGTSNSDKGFVCTSNQSGTINTTAITFVQFTSVNLPQSLGTSATPTFAGLILNGTGFLQLPNGTSGTPVNGVLRFNSTTGKNEIYESGAWNTIVKDVLSTLLAGYSVGTNSAIASSDSILQAFQKIQAQINARSPLNGTSSQFVKGDGSYDSGVYVKKLQTTRSLNGQVLNSNDNYEFTVTLTGVAVGDLVNLSLDNLAYSAFSTTCDLSLWGCVSAANTVKFKIRASEYTSITTGNVIITVIK